VLSNKQSTFPSNRDAPFSLSCFRDALFSLWFPPASIHQDNTGSDNIGFPHHGAYWYWRPHRAVGFASMQQIRLNHADMCDVAAEDRLSWHFQQSGNGGWRVGDVKGLDKKAGPWRKRIYVWPAH
jgi:hypothetical protein